MALVRPSEVNTSATVDQGFLESTANFQQVGSTSVLLCLWYIREVCSHFEFCVIENKGLSWSKFI